MKKILLFFLLFGTLFSCRKKYVEIRNTMRYEIVNSPTSEHLRTVFFLDGSTGYVGGDRGSIYRTSDGGQTWTDLSIYVNNTVYALYFLNASTGFACTNNDILKTTDGGQTWTAGFLSGKFRAIDFATPNIGYAVGSFSNDGIIYKTTNGGQSWFNVTFPNMPPPFNALSVLNKDTVYITGVEFETHKTMNGGSNWWLMPGETHYTDTAYATHFLSYDNGFAAGDFGLLEAYPEYAPMNTDGYKYTYYGTSFFGGKGIMVGENNILGLFDDPNFPGATKWINIYKPDGTSFAYDLRAVHYVDPTTIYAVGYGGVIIRLTPN